MAAGSRARPAIVPCAKPCVRQPEAPAPTRVSALPAAAPRRHSAFRLWAFKATERVLVALGGRLARLLRVSDRLGESQLRHGQQARQRVG